MEAWTPASKSAFSSAYRHRRHARRPALYDELAPLRATYRFRLVPIPVLGEPSQRAVLGLACQSGSDPEQAREALLGGCATGNPEYACPGYPGKRLCLPPSAVYSLSEGALTSRHPAQWKPSADSGSRPINSVHRAINPA